jgi:hypothetical protein
MLWKRVYFHCCLAMAGSTLSTILAFSHHVTVLLYAQMEYRVGHKPIWNTKNLSLNVQTEKYRIWVRCITLEYKEFITDFPNRKL